MKRMLMLTIGMAICSAAAQADVYVVQPPSNYYYYSEYQPDNGPMRGPNSLDWYKYHGHQRPYHYYNRPYDPYAQYRYTDRPYHW